MIKIQINSLEALNRLIGNDKELEIEIRNTIVQKFAKNHLKALVNDELMKSTGQAVASELKNEFFNIENAGSFREKATFNAKVTNELKKELSNAANRELREIVQEVIEERKCRLLIETKLNFAAEYITDELTEANLERRLDRLVDKRLKERLDIKD